MKRAAKSDTSGKTTPIPVRLDESQLARADLCAKKEARSRSAFIRILFLRSLEDYERENRIPRPAK